MSADKKKYEKPRVKLVKLAAEEAVLSHCKVTEIPGTEVLCVDTRIPATFGSYAPF